MLHREAARPDPAPSASDQAKRVVDQRTVELAQLRWALNDQASRLARARRTLAATVPYVDVAQQARQPFEAPSPEGPSAAVPNVEPPPAEAPRRRLRVTVSESREVSLEVEDRIPAPTALIEHPHQRAS